MKKLSLIGLVAVLLASFAPTNTANAWTTNPLPSCSDSNTNNVYDADMNWVNKIQEVSGINITGGSYLIAGVGSDVRVYYAPSDINMHYGTTSNQSQQYGIYTTDINSKIFIKTDTNSQTVTDYGSWANSDTAYMTTGISCITAAKNINYTSAYTTQGGSTSYAVYTAPAPANTCNSWDIACHVANVFTNVADTFIGVGQAIVNGIAALFKPDGAVLAVIFNDLSTFFVDKFGFLSYPVVFFVEIFNAAIVEPLPGGCNAPCTGNEFAITNLQFGNFFGGNVSIDLLGIQKMSGDLWNLMQLFLQGATVLTLIFAFRRKYMEVIQT